MNFRDIVIPTVLTLAVLMGVNYFFAPAQQEDAPTERGEGFTVAAYEDRLRPLHTEVDFDDATLSGETTSHTIDTSRATYGFTNEAGAVHHMHFVHPSDAGTHITTLDISQQGHEAGAFLAALEERTPFYYSLDAQQEYETYHEISYSVHTENARITKTYCIHKDSYQIDMQLSIEPLVQEGVRPRIFLPAPYMPEVAQDAPRLVVYKEQDKLHKYALNDISHKAWKQPALFGAENKYMIHVLAQDHDGFVQRGYARIFGEYMLSAILEGPQITQKQTWQLSFYCGPKEADALNAVDERLEEALDYGWFAPVSKFMLRVLQWIYAYVGNYGWAIVLLTLIMRLLLLPFSVGGESRVSSKAGEFARKKKLLEQKYKDDQETLAREQFKLAKEYGMFPGLSGCLPMLLQIPVFLGLNYALRNSILLYKAPFMLWIHDLSAPDPYYILPIFIGGSLLVNALTTQEKQQQMTLAILSVILIGVTANISAGLALYIAMSSMLGVAQTVLSRKLRS